MELRASGRSIVLTTHYMDEAERLCDRVSIVDHGKVIALGSPRELIASLGAEHVVEFTTPGAPPDSIPLHALKSLDGVTSAREHDGRWTLEVRELARAWVEQYSKSDRDRDDNFFAMMDYERDLREEDPHRAIDVIVEILRNETNPVLLSLLAAGPLEDVISMDTIDRIEREAKSDKRFHDLLGGVWYYRASDELKARLDVLVGGVRW